jgi:hypothetical protein
MGRYSSNPLNAETLHDAYSAEETKTVCMQIPTLWILLRLFPQAARESTGIAMRSVVVVIHVYSV